MLGFLLLSAAVVIAALSIFLLTRKPTTKVLSVTDSLGTTYTVLSECFYHGVNSRGQHIVISIYEDGPVRIIERLEQEEIGI